MLTKKELRRLAKEARVLAMECAGGTAPNFGTGDLWDGDGPLCALGHLCARAGATSEAAMDSPYVGMPTYEKQGVVAANDLGPREALPWMLLALGDALEDAAQPPKEDL